ncbi:hypothetical protein GF389_00710 [Candidatus Dojkabacteria bacterium]|nr:hypothetical protein [Candidatus Dojkabacteria bacterium]
MDANEIAIKIYKEVSKLESQELRVLEILAMTEGADVKKVLNVYRSIVSGSTGVVDVVTKYSLSDEQRKKIEKGISKQFEKEVLFAYEVNKYQDELMKVKIGNKLLEFNQ